MRLDTMAATSISGAAAVALAITACMALMGGNGLAYVLLFGLFQAQVAAACTVANEEPDGILGEELVPHGNTVLVPLCLPFPLLPSPHSPTTLALPAS